MYDLARPWKKTIVDFGLDHESWGIGRTQTTRPLALVPEAPTKSVSQLVSRRPDLALFGHGVQEEKLSPD